MKLIIETDCGHDPDDFFTILWLLSVGVDIKAICVHPGDKDQVAIVAFIRKIFNLDFPIGVAKPNREKLSSGSVHYDILKRYNYPVDKDSPDGEGKEVIANVMKDHPDCEFFVIGPVTSVGRYFEENNPHVKRATMQGGFLPYSIYRPAQVLDKFEGKDWVPTFNLNGDRKSAIKFMDANIDERRFIGKNVCHTVVYDKSIQERLKPHDEPSKLFKEAMDLYLCRHEGKKFHDPTAAVCHLNPNIASWVRGKVVKMETGWSTMLDDNADYIASDLDYEKLWNCITNFTKE